MQYNKIFIFGIGGLDITGNGVQQLKTSLPKNWKSLRLTGIGKEESTFIVKK